MTHFQGSATRGSISVLNAQHLEPLVCEHQVRAAPSRTGSEQNLRTGNGLAAEQPALLHLLGLQRWAPPGPPAAQTHPETEPLGTAAASYVPPLPAPSSSHPLLLPHREGRGTSGSLLGVSSEQLTALVCWGFLNIKSLHSPAFRCVAEANGLRVRGPFRRLSSLVSFTSSFLWGVVLSLWFGLEFWCLCLFVCSLTPCPHHTVSAVRHKICCVQSLHCFGPW